MKKAQPEVAAKKMRHQKIGDPGFMIVNIPESSVRDGGAKASEGQMTQIKGRAVAKTYASDALAAAHELAEGLHAAGLYDAPTMREFDELCLTVISPMGPQDIRNLRDTAGVSQAVLARVLNVTPNAVGQWERGEKRPTGSALKLLSLVRSKGLRTIL